MRLASLLQKPLLIVAGEDLERINQSRGRGSQVDPESLDQCRRRDPEEDQGQSGSLERRNLSVDLNSGPTVIVVNTNRRILNNTINGLTMLQSRGWRLRKQRN